jgi:hypothetical protein
MSLVSCITNYGLPIIISDLALSDSEEVSPIFIPILNKKYSELDFPFDIKPSAFALKTIIIQNKLCVAGTGNVSLLKEIFNDTIDFFLHRKVTVDTLKELQSLRWRKYAGQA